MTQTSSVSVRTERTLTPPLLLVRRGADVPAWVTTAGATMMSLPERTGPGASQVDAGMATVLAGATCVLIDGEAPDALDLARSVHQMEPEIQTVLVVNTEASRGRLERAMVFTPGVGELWLVSPREVAGGVTERAAGVTRQRRKFRRTRQRLENERIESSPQRSNRASISDEFLANLLQVLPNPVFAVDESGRILSANAASRRVLRANGTNSFVGVTLEEALGTSAVSLARLFGRAGQPSQTPISFRRAQEGAGFGELLVAQIGTTEPPVYAVLLNDLTAQHEAQEELEAQARELECANEQLQEQATELESQAEELRATIAELEERSEQAERARAELAESERQFRTLADTIPTIAWTARADGHIDWYNARWFEYTGTAAHEMEGWGWQSVHDPLVLPSVLELWQRSIATGSPFEMTFPLRGADGTFRRFLTRVTPVRASSGEIVRWFGINTDVEAEHQALAAATDARAEAEQLRHAAEDANRAKSEFLSTMSHELRTPLNAIQGYAELLALGIRGPVTEMQLQDLERIRRANQHLLSLITDILNFARLEAGKVELHLDAVDVASLLVDVESLVSPQMASKGLTFDHSGCDLMVDGKPYAVLADPEKLRQVLLNLLTNAIKFTPAGGQVGIACAGDVDENVVQVRVYDTGCGVPTEQHERIFEPFVQVDRHQTHASQQGVGLGLAISRELVRSMNGEITLSSEVGVGSTFTVTLPRA